MVKSASKPASSSALFIQMLLLSSIASSLAGKPSELKGWYGPLAFTYEDNSDLTVTKGVIQGGTLKLNGGTLKIVDSTMEKVLVVEGKGTVICSEHHKNNIKRKEGSNINIQFNSDAIPVKPPVQLPVKQLVLHNGETVKLDNSYSNSIVEVSGNGVISQSTVKNSDFKIMPNGVIKIIGCDFTNSHIEGLNTDLEIGGTNLHNTKVKSEDTNLNVHDCVFDEVKPTKEHTQTPAQLMAKRAEQEERQKQNEKKLKFAEHANQQPTHEARRPGKGR